MRDVRQRMDFVVEDASVFPIGKPTDILVRDPRNDLFNDLFTFTSYDHIDIRATVEQIFNFLSRFIAADDCAGLGRQVGDEITDFLELRFPSDAYAQKIDFVPNEPTECLRVLVGFLIPKVEKRHLTDQVFQARGDVFQAGWGKSPYDCSGIPEIGVQGESVLILDHGLDFERAMIRIDSRSDKIYGNWRFMSSTKEHRV